MSELTITLTGKLAAEYFTLIENMRLLEEKVKVSSEYITALEAKLEQPLTEPSNRVERDTEIAKDLQSE